MVGVALTLLVALGWAGLGSTLLSRWLVDRDPSLRFGTGGLLGLGLLGTITLFIGLIPGGFGWGIFLVGLGALTGAYFLIKARSDISFQVPKGVQAIAFLALAIPILFALVSVLAPSTAEDWDTIAYHLAVPKLWLSTGQIHFIPALHQSNFPDVLDALYVWGLQWGGQSGAKAFSLAVYTFGIFSVFGFARGRYGSNAGWWAAIAFATVPAIMWESGTAYIDVGHGLYAGLAIAFLALFIESEFAGHDWILAAILFGFAAGTKYTGLETIAVALFVLVAVSLLRKRAPEGFKKAVLIGLISVSIASPWYVKNAIQNHNPVFPFLYEKLGGDNWDQKRADAYKNEQQSFGVGRTASGRDVMGIGHAILGLAYEPGRYVNPGEVEGLGAPSGAIGVVVLVSLLIWAGTAKRKLFESFTLAVLGVNFVPWFFLSQQSRYMTTLAPPAAILAGGAVGLASIGLLMSVLTVLQAAYSLWLFQTTRFSDQIQVVTGKVTVEDYLKPRLAFASAAPDVNEKVKGGKVALYDEVFGFLLDVPYMWSNPPHSTLIPYDAMSNADDYVIGLKKLGFTHVYISTSRVVKDPSFVQKWLATMGFQGAPQPFTSDERTAMMANWQDKWEVLLSDAVAEGKLRPVGTYRSGVLFALP